MGQFSVLSKTCSSELEFTAGIQHNHGASCYKDLYGVNKVLLLLNEHGDPSLLFPNLSSYNINNQSIGKV